MGDWTISGTRLVAYSGPGGDVKIPEGITEAGKVSWKRLPYITALTIPGTLRKIPDLFCYGMWGLESVTVGKGVEEIGASAFHYTRLRSISLPGTVRQIGEHAFRDTNLMHITIPDGILEIRSQTFTSCSRLETVRLPGTLRSLGYGAFSMSGLKEVTIPAGVEKIGGRAFVQCRNLTAIHLPPSLRLIDDFAFADTALEEVTIPEGTEEIGNDCFSRCEHLRSLRLPASLNSLGTLNRDPMLSEVIFSSVPWTMETMTLQTAARIVVLSSVPPDRLNYLVRNLRLPKGSILEADHVSFEGLTLRARLLLFRSWDKRLRQGESFPDEIRPGILKAMRKDRVRLWRAGLLRHMLLEEGLLSLQNVRSFLESAQKEHDVELTAQLLEYQNRHFPPEEVARRDQARIRRAMTGLTLPEEMETGPSDGQP